MKSQQSKLIFERGLQATEKNIIQFVNEFVRPQAEVETDEEYQKRIIDNLVNAVYIYDDKIVVWFNIKGGKNIEFIDKTATDEAIRTCTADPSGNIKNGSLAVSSAAAAFGGS